MAPKKRAFAELGFVANRAGSYIAKLRTREEQQIRYIDGPRRGIEQRALGDLNAIRAAVPADASREDGFEAMEAAAKRLKADAAAEAAAKRLKADAAAEAGGVEKVGHEYRARVRYVTSSGGRHNIYGPCRGTDSRAQADLETMRAAAAEKPTRAEYLEAN